MRTLSRIRHPNIITVMGAVIRTKDPMLVMELCEHGRYVYVCMHVCMYAYMHVCMYVCVVICVCSYVNEGSHACDGAV